MNAQLGTGDESRALTESLQGIIEEWLDHEQAEGASANTVSAYRKGLNVFIAWLRESNTTPGMVTPQIVRQFKVDLAKRYSVQTVNLRLTAVRSFYRFMVVTGRLPVNPAAEVKGVKRPKSRQHKRDALTNGEVVSVLKTCDLGTLEGVRDRAILSLMAYCAARSVEVHRADVGDLRTKGDRLVLAVQGKGRTETDEVLIIPRSQEDVVRSWLSHRLTFAEGDGALFVSLSRRNRGERLSLRAIRRMVKARYRQAGVVGDGKTTHSLRHSAITNAIRNQATPMQVQAMARHTSFDTTLGYYHEAARLDNPAEDLIHYEK